MLGCRFFSEAEKGEELFRKKTDLIISTYDHVKMKMQSQDLLRNSLRYDQQQRTGMLHFEMDIPILPHVLNGIRSLVQVSIFLFWFWPERRERRIVNARKVS